VKDSRSQNVYGNILILTRDLKMMNVCAKITMKHFSGKQERKEKKFGQMLLQDCGRTCPSQKIQ
jgi:hypothetical protein